MATENMMTYELLYDILRKEKYSQELQKLDQNFFRSVIKYIEEKTAISESQKNKESIFSTEAEKTEKQLLNIKKLLKELYEKRESKIAQLALFSSRMNERDVSSTLLPEERQFFVEILDLLNKYRKGIIENVIEKRLPVIEKEQPKEIKREISEPQSGNEMKVIRLLHPVPQFIANDLKTYGPLEEEETCVLPKETADVLIKKKRAEEIKSEITQESHAVLQEV